MPDTIVVVLPGLEACRLIGLSVLIGYGGLLAASMVWLTWVTRPRRGTQSQKGATP